MLFWLRRHRIDCELVEARLSLLRRVDPVKADALAMNLDRIAIDHRGAADDVSLRSA